MQQSRGSLSHGKHRSIPFHGRGHVNPWLWMRDYRKAFQKRRVKLTVWYASVQELMRARLMRR